MQTYIHTTFEDDQRAQAGVQALLDAGFPTQDISLAQIKDSHAEAKPLRHRTGTFRFGAIGAAVGALAGAILALVVPGLATDITLLEGFEEMLSQTPLLAALQGAFVGSVGGGLLAGIVGIGFWKEKPAIDADADCVRVGVHTQQGHAERAIEALKKLGARNIECMER